MGSTLLVAYLTAASLSSAEATNAPWNIPLGGHLVVTAIGSSATLAGYFDVYLLNSSTQQLQCYPVGTNFALVPFNSTVDNVFDIRFTWGAANSSNTINTLAAALWIH